MARYQIRTPADMVIQDVVKLMSARAKEVLSAWEVFLNEPRNEDWNCFTDEIRKSLAPYVKSYKLCGISSACSERLKSTSWSNESHVLEATPQDMIYQLLPRKELDQFLEEVATRARKSLRPWLKPGSEQGVLSSLRVVFRCVLGDYLYFNSVCGHAELCSCSVRAPSPPPWNKK